MDSVLGTFVLAISQSGYLCFCILKLKIIIKIALIVTHYTMQVADPEFDDGQNTPGWSGVADPHGVNAGVPVMNAGANPVPNPDPIVRGPFMGLTPPPKPSGMHPLIIALVVIAFVIVITRS